MVGKYVGEGELRVNVGNDGCIVVVTLGVCILIKN